MRAAVLLILLTGGLAGCAAGGAGLTDRLAGPNRVRGDAKGVRVAGFASRVEALPLAVGHCARFGRAAQFDRRDGDAYVFRCVPN